MTISVYSQDMLLTVRIKLLTNASQKDSLLRTMQAFNCAATFAAKQGFEHKIFSRPGIHHLSYYKIRESTGLTAQLAINAIGRAVGCFVKDKTKCPHFRPRSAVIYDRKVLRFKGLTHVSIATIDGRLVMPVVLTGYHTPKLIHAVKSGYTELTYTRGCFYLLSLIDVEPDQAIEASDVIGVDFGITNIATDSDGTIYSGESIESTRVRTTRLVSALQSCGTRSARRHMKRMRKRESNFRTTVNHQISRRIVDSAKARNCAIAIEDLTGIRQRTRFPKDQRGKMFGWAFCQLRYFMTYKSTLAGVPLIVVDPKYTSQTCSHCGHRHKGNRKSQALFVCKACGHNEHADVNAARNIRAKGYASKPIVTSKDPQCLYAAS